MGSCHKQYGPRLPTLVLCKLVFIYIAGKPYTLRSYFMFEPGVSGEYIFRSYT